MREPIRRRPSRRAVLPVALSLAVAAVAIAQQRPADGPGTSPEVNPPGRVMAAGMGATSNPSGTGVDAVPITPSTPAVKGLQATLAHLSTAAATPHGHDDLLKLLSPADRQRLAATPADWADVDRAAEAFESAWQAQFGQSFKVDDKIDIVFSEPTTHVELPATTDPAAAGSTARPTAVRIVGPGGRAATVVRFAQDRGGDHAWRLVLPASATAATLHDGLLRHLTAVTADHARWPTELGQAYIYTTQRLLSAMGESVPVPR